MSASVKWSGLEELKRDLRNLPEDLAGEAGHIVEEAANGTAVDVKRGYAAHRRSGRLAGGVTVTHFEAGKYSAGAIVKNSAPHAYIFEVGTQARHTAIGANRGSMPPGNVFIPAAQKNRRRMYDRLKDMLVRFGAVVTGDAR